MARSGPYYRARGGGAGQRQYRLVVPPAEAAGRLAVDLGPRAGVKLASVLNKGGEEVDYSSVGPGTGFALGGGTYELDLLAQYDASEDTGQYWRMRIFMVMLTAATRQST